VKTKQTAPKSRMLKFEKESFLCDNGGHDCGIVYSYRGQWLCCPCLKCAVRANGGDGVAVYGATSLKEVERVLRAGNMRCLTPKILPPVVIPVRHRAKPAGRPDPDCEWCGGSGCEECLAEAL